MYLYVPPPVPHAHLTVVLLTFPLGSHRFVYEEVLESWVSHQVSDAFNSIMLPDVHLLGEWFFSWSLLVTSDLDDIAVP